MEEWNVQCNGTCLFMTEDEGWGSQTPIDSYKGCVLYMDNQRLLRKVF